MSSRPPLQSQSTNKYFLGHPKRPRAKKREVTLEPKMLQVSFEGLAVHEGSKTI